MNRKSYLDRYNRKTQIMKVHTYLSFDGRAGEAFDFYRSVFGGEFTARSAMADVPEGRNLPEKERGKVMHVSLPIGDGTVLMGSDRVWPEGDGPVKCNNVYIVLSPASREEADYLFRALSEDGDIEVHLRNSFRSDRYGSLTDRFGVKWMVDFGEGNGETMRELEELLPQGASEPKPQAPPLDVAGPPNQE